MRKCGIKTHRAMSYAKLELVGRWLRQLLCPGISDTAPMPGKTVFETLEAREASCDGKQYCLSYDVQKLAPGVEARTRLEEDGTLMVTLSLNTYYGLEVEDGRARFTLYHELTHAFLHVRELVRLAELHPEELALLRATPPSHPRYYDSEWQADGGAAAALMPAKGLAELELSHGPLTINMLMNTYIVSAEAARVRMNVYYSRRDELLAA